MNTTPTTIEAPRPSHPPRPSRTPRELREASGLTLDQLDRKTGIGRPTLSRVERGYTKLDDERIESIARALGVRPVTYKRAVERQWELAK